MVKQSRAADEDPLNRRPYDPETAVGSLIEYDHDHHSRFHTEAGARATLQALFPKNFPPSVLDVGCGTGTWLKAALDGGAKDVMGVDGVRLSDDILLVPRQLVRHADLNFPLRLGRKFDLVLCLETAEHLDAQNSQDLVESLVCHGDRILFSAAAPGQHGTHHVNCQWPEYWQQLFNDRGYTCDDAVRWIIWDKPLVEPWYRQNLMMAIRDEAGAGQEPRIRRVVHPDMITYYGWSFFQENIKRLEDGALPIGWYALAPLKAFKAKLQQLAARLSNSLKKP